MAYMYCSNIWASYLPKCSLPPYPFCVCISSAYTICAIDVCPLMCVKISIAATRDHLPRGDTFAPNRQCPLVAGTTVYKSDHSMRNVTITSSFTLVKGTHFIVEPYGYCTTDIDSVTESCASYVVYKHVVMLSMTTNS